jgi:AraC-like DNA-binding protein
VSAFEGDVDAGTDAVDGAYNLMTALTGRLALDVGRMPVLVDAGMASITSPGLPVRSRIQAGFAAVSVVIPQAVMTRALTALDVPPLPSALQFVPAVSLASPPGAAIARLVQHALHTIDDDLMTPQLGVTLTDALVHSLLAHLPHSHATRLGRPAATPTPRAVRLAEAYIESNLDQTLTLTEIAIRTGVGARSLGVGFMAHRGKSVLQFVRERRLARARDLLSTGAYTTVAEVALACGCSHLGRFSIRYREAFGESAKATLARALGRSPRGPTA